MPVNKPSWKTPLFAMKLAAIILIGIILLAIYAKTNHSTYIQNGTSPRLMAEPNNSNQLNNYRLIEFQNTYIPTNEISDILSLADSKTTLIFYWATWCPNCKQQLNSLDQLQKEFSEKLKIITLNIDKTNHQKIAKKYWSDLGLNIPTLFDPDSKSLGLFKIDVLPTAILLSTKGQYFLKIDGPINWQDSVLKNKIQTYL